MSELTQHSTRSKHINGEGPHLFPPSRHHSDKSLKEQTPWICTTCLIYKG